MKGLGRVEDLRVELSGGFGAVTLGLRTRGGLGFRVAARKSMDVPVYALNQRSLTLSVSLYIYLCVSIYIYVCIYIYMMLIWLLLCNYNM